MDEILWCYHSNETFLAVLSDGTIESADEIVWCYHSTETSSAVLSQGTNYLARSSNF